MYRPTINRGLARKLAAAGSLAILAAAVSACSSTDATSTASAGATASASGNSALAAEVEKLTKPLDAYPVPTEAISGVSGLKGKTVYYIPITLQSPQFSVTQKALEAAAATVGITVQTCDGKGTPTDITACVNQAVDAKAGTVITDAIPYAMASNAFDAAKAAGVPVIISNQTADDSHPASDKLAYILAPGSEMSVALAKWMALDSSGSGNMLINQSADGPAPAAFVAAGNDALKTDCPNCKVTINEVTSANFSLIPSSTSSALLKDSTINYVQSQFEQYLQVTQTGVQQSGMTVKGMTGAAQLGGLQALASNSFLYAAASQASAYQGWVDLDASMRLMLGTAVPDYTIPVRLFTRDTIKDVQLTDAAQASGEWYGPTTFTDDFKKLWGIA